MASVRAPLLFNYPYSAQALASARNQQVAKHPLGLSYIMPPHIETEIHRRQMLSRGPLNGFGWPGLQTDSRFKMSGWPHKQMHCEPNIKAPVAPKLQPTSKYFEHVKRTLERRSSAIPSPSDLERLRTNSTSRDTCTLTKEESPKKKARSLSFDCVSPKAFEEKVKESNLLHETEQLAEELAYRALNDKFQLSLATEKNSTTCENEFPDFDKIAESPSDLFCGNPSTLSNCVWRYKRPEDQIVKSIHKNLSSALKDDSHSDLSADLATDDDYEELRRDSVEFTGSPKFHGAVGDSPLSSSDTGYASFPRDLDFEDIYTIVDE